MFRLNILGTDECFVLGCYSFLYIWRNNAQGLDVQPETPLPGTRISTIRVGKRASRASRRYMTSGSRVFEKGRESGVRVFTVDAPIQRSPSRSFVNFESVAVKRTYVCRIQPLENNLLRLVVGTGSYLRVSVTRT
jgi:hypothetical protein